MSAKKHPYARMIAALDVVYDVHARPDSPSEWRGSSAFYLSPGRSISYRQRRPLKTRQGALDRQKRETIAFLKELRNQIDDVLVKLETAVPDEHNYVWATSYTYAPKNGDTP